MGLNRMLTMFQITDEEWKNLRPEVQDMFLEAEKVKQKFEFDDYREKCKDERLRQIIKEELEIMMKKLLDSEK